MDASYSGIARYKFELISEHHDVSLFDCQRHLLNEYLKNEALTETKRHISRTIVLIDQGFSPSGIIGYYTTMPSVLYETPESGKVLAIKVAELCYFAVDAMRQRQGIGTFLLTHALKEIAKATALLGLAGVTLNAIPEVKDFYQQFNFGAHPFGDPYMFLTVTDLMTHWG